MCWGELANEAAAAERSPLFIRSCKHVIAFSTAFRAEAACFGCPHWASVSLNNQAAAANDAERRMRQADRLRPKDPMSDDRREDVSRSCTFNDPFTISIFCRRLVRSQVVPLANLSP